MGDGEGETSAGLGQGERQHCRRAGESCRLQHRNAKPWAEQTARALAGASAAGTPIENGLTSTELRIAVLVRDGASNREIANQLYLSVKTVEATLTRVYRKLGVRSRTQLSSRLPAAELAPTRVFPDSVTVVDA